MDLSIKYNGLTLKNPIVIGSSALTSNVNSIKELAENGAGAVVLKSLFQEQINIEMDKASNQDFHDYPEAHDYAKYYAKEEALQNYLNLISEAKKEVNIPIIASINCVDNTEWTAFAMKIEDAGADAIELNVAILPSDVEKSSKENEKKYFDIIEKVKSIVNIPITLKMSNFSSGLAQLIQKISWTKNVDSIVLFNRFYSPDIDINKMEITSSNTFSTAAEIGTSLRWIALMSGKIDTDLIASTGVHNSEGVIKQILAGANAVQMVSAIYQHKASYIKIVLKEVEEWMSKNNYSSINDFKGKLSYKNVNDSVSYERIQFMKYFGGIE